MGDNSSREPSGQPGHEWAGLSREGMAILRGFSERMGRIVGGPLETAAGILQDRLQFVRLRQLVKLKEKTERLLAERGLTDSTRSVPLNIAVPLLEAASLEEDDELQEMWARLLVNAVDKNSGVEIRRVYVSILQDFGPLEARLLSAIVTGHGDEDGYIRTEKLPDRVVTKEPEEGAIYPPEPVRLALWNLVRLGCITPGMFLDGLKISLVAPTELGRGLAVACGAQSERDREGR